MNWTGKVKQLCFTPDVDISDDVDHLDFHSPDTYVCVDAPNAEFEVF